MRKRTKEVLFRMTDEEYIFFSEKVAESGLSKQKYLLAAALFVFNFGIINSPFYFLASIKNILLPSK